MSRFNPSSLHAAALELNVPIPSDFICPITGDVMDSPVMTRAGMNFERDAIIETILNGTSIVCPKTKKNLDLAAFVPNRKLEDKILYWKFENQLPDIKQKSSSARDENRVIGIISPTKKRAVHSLYRAALAASVLDIVSN